MSEVAFWNPVKAASQDVLSYESGNGTGEIERTSFEPDVTVAARYKHEVTMHQGRIERILEENLQLYFKGGIVQLHHFVDFRLDGANDPEYPVIVTVDEESGDGVLKRKLVRTKYLVGADGAHSKVRQAMGLRLEGETTDHIWGVVDFVADTTFPDIRKRCAIHSDAGSVMIIPRERISSGEYLTRLYVQIEDEVQPDDNVTGNSKKNQPKDRSRRAAITVDFIFNQARRVFAPYHMQIKEGTEVDWWAAYQIGQRMTPRFSMKDNIGVERVFIIGDGKHKFIKAPQYVGTDA